jgi:hypothetical protein
LRNLCIFWKEIEKKCNKFAELVHIVTGTAAVVGNFCSGFALDYRSDLGYNIATFQEFVSGNAILKVRETLKVGKETKMKKQKKSLFFAAVVFSLFMSGFASAINDPVAHWKLDEASGTTASDSVGTNDGTLINGPVWTTGIVDGALDFDGIDDYVDCESTFASVTASDTKSIMAWVKPDSAAEAARIITLYRRSDSSSAFALRFYGTPATWSSLYMKSATSYEWLDSGVQVGVDEWTHIALVQNGTQVDIYVNGISENSVGNGAVPTLSNPPNAVLGAYMWWGHYPTGGFNGIIDDVRIYDRALSAEEIQWLYLGEQPELVGLEIAGPDEVPEDSQTQYSAIALYDNDSTADVTDDALWSVEPNVIADIEAGLLTTEKIFQPEELQIVAQYTEDGNTFDANKPVSVFAICPSGSALQFDGLDDYVDFSDNAVKTTEFTVAAWANHYGLGGGHDNQNRIFSQRDDSVGDNHPSIGLVTEFTDYSPYAVAVIRSSSGYAQYLRHPKKDYNEWHHYAMTVDSNDFIFYIDGAEVEKAPNIQTGDYVTSIDHVSIGRHQYEWADAGFFNGAIDDVRIYDRALSAEEIWVGMHIPLSGDEPNLVGYWDFDEGEGQVAHDTSGNANDGQLGSGPDADDSDPNWVDSDAPIGICTLQELVERNVNEALEIKLNILDEILEALAREDASVNILDGLFGELEYGYLDKTDIRRAGQEIHSAIQSEEQATHSIEKSVDDLEDSLEILTNENESPESNSPNDSRQMKRLLVPLKK